MGILFEWDSNKAIMNVAKHAISFEEATTVFGDELSITIESKVKRVTERRFVTIGSSVKNRILVVVHTARGQKIRIISSRMASKNERKQYFNEK